MRLILLFVALVTVYVLARRDARADGPLRLRSETAFLLAAVAALGLLLALQFLIDQGPLVPVRGLYDLLQFLRLFDIDALVAGGVIGYLLAEQQTGAEDAVRTAAADAPAGGDGHGVVERATGVIRSAAGGALMVALVLVAAVPPAVWPDLLRRVQSVNAAGVQLSLGSGDARLAEDISRAVQPNDVVDRNDRDSSQRGFASQRLERLASLTYPPDARGATLATDPSRLLFSGRQARAGWGASRSRHIERDRAYILMIAAGGEAEYDRRPPDRITALVPSIQAIGQTQERMLGLLGPEIECLGAYVSLTGDRRLIQFEAHDVLRHLVAFSRSWMRLERRAIEARLGAAPVTPHLTREGQAAWHAGGAFARSLSAFIGYLADATYDYRGQGYGDRDESRACWVDMLGRLPAMLARLAPEPRDDAPQRDPLDPDTLPDHGFTPYLTLAAAQALSSVGDHVAAVRLLLDWLDARSGLEQLLARGEAQTPWPAQEAVRRALAWHRLQVATEIVFIQGLAEYAGEEPSGIAATSEGTLRLVLERFAATFRLIGETGGFAAWRRSAPAGGCTAGSQRWRQPLVASYLSHVNSYLELRNRQFVDPRDVTPEDIRLAELLAEIDTECFSDINRLPERLLDSAGFAITSAAMRMNLLSTAEPRRLSQAEAERLRTALDLQLRRAEADMLARLGMVRQDLPLQGDLELQRAAWQDGAEAVLRNARALRARLNGRG
jgi:hypothetical protein